MTDIQPLNAEELSTKYQWDQFPQEIQTRLYAHYLEFNHEGNLRKAERDVQSASDTLSWAQQQARLDPLLEEHLHYFEQPSTDDLVALIHSLQQSPS